MTNYRKQMVKELRVLAKKAAKIRNVSVPTISHITTKDARFIPSVLDGGNFTIGRYESVVKQLEALVKK